MSNESGGLCDDLSVEYDLCQHRSNLLNEVPFGILAEQRKYVKPQMIRDDPAPTAYASNLTWIVRWGLESDK
jgi:hypothetical protein